jgi:hypothetical protein
MMKKTEGEVSERVSEREREEGDRQRQRERCLQMRLVDVRSIRVLAGLGRRATSKLVEAM